MATSILRSFTFRAEKANPALFRALGETTDASKSGRILRFPVVHQAAKTALAPEKRPLIPTRRTSARNQTLQHWRMALTDFRKLLRENLRTCNPALFLVYSLDVVLLLATGILPEKEPVHFSFHAQREGRRAGVDSAACTATAEKTAKTRF